VVIGAKGQMGRVRAQLSRSGQSRDRIRPSLDLDALPGAVRGAALVLLCVPITAMQDVVTLVAPHLTQATILADICSVKVQPLHDMLARPQRPWSAPIHFSVPRHLTRSCVLP
jgi:Prephenate dehydrogenase